MIKKKKISELPKAESFDNLISNGVNDSGDVQFSISDIIDFIISNGISLQDIPNVNFATTTLYDKLGMESAVWDTRMLYDKEGRDSLDWENQVLTSKEWGNWFYWGSSYLEAGGMYGYDFKNGKFFVFGDDVTVDIYNGIYASGYLPSGQAILDHSAKKLGWYDAETWHWKEVTYNQLYNAVNSAEGSYLAEELTKFSASPTFDPDAGYVSSKQIDCIKIINTSDFITPENGFFVGWQVLNTRRNIGGAVIHPKAHWGTITGDVMNATGTDIHTSFPPLKNDLTTGLKKGVIRTGVGSAPSHISIDKKRANGSETDNRKRYILNLKRIGRSYKIRFVSSLEGNIYAGDVLLPKTVKIPIRLVLGQSRRAQGSEGVILRNIRTLKILWEGLITFSPQTSAYTLSSGLTT